MLRPLSATRTSAVWPCGTMAMALLFGLSAETSWGQDRLKTMPGYERYQKLRREIAEAVKLGALSVTWTNEGKAFEYRKDGIRYRYDIATRKAEVRPAAEAPRQEEERRNEGRRPNRDRSGRVERGRQFTSATSPDGKW